MSDGFLPLARGWAYSRAVERSIRTLVDATPLPEVPR
jgi:hypothetical protein